MSANPMVVPDHESTGRLKALIFEHVDIVARIRDANPNLAQQWPQLFLFLAYSWIVDPEPLSAEQKEFLEDRKREIAELTFDGAAVKKQLEDVLTRDKHLAECCPTLLYLANFLDTFFITATADAKRQDREKYQTK